MRRAANINDLRHVIARDGIVGVPGAFRPEWADRLRDDFDVAFAAARADRTGLLDRGPHRWYFAVHPECLQGFADLITHPVIHGLAETMLGSDYQFVEIGFDVPLPGAQDQPWHRDFPADEDTASGRLTSLAFNVTTVDVEADMGPLEIAPGTHWDLGDHFADGMFPAPDRWRRYEQLAVRKFPRRGDLSARSGLAVHRGTANTSGRQRAVLVLGATTAATVTDAHDLQVTRAFHASLPPATRAHLRCTLVDELQPIRQRHRIEGLVAQPM